MELEGKKVIILVEDMFNVFEFWYPYYRLKEAAAQVTVVGSGRTDEFTGKPATQIRPDISADAVSSGDYDGVIIPGGYAPDMMRRFPAMVRIVKELFDAGKVVAAIYLPMLSQYFSSCDVNDRTGTSFQFNSPGSLRHCKR